MNGRPSKPVQCFVPCPSLPNGLSLRHSVLSGRTTKLVPWITIVYKLHFTMER